MLAFYVFATLHRRSASSLSRLSVLGELCVKIPASFHSHPRKSSRFSAKLHPKSSFHISALRALRFSVSHNPFVCHSYENNRGVSQQFPFWNSTSSARYSNLQPPTSNLCLFTLFRTLLHSPKTQLFSFHAIPHSFAETPGGGVSPPYKSLLNCIDLTSQVADPDGSFPDSARRPRSKA
jgi:hypothetical protein